MLVRGIERDVLPTCQKYGMGVLSWSPLAGGWLSGAFGPGRENTSRRATVIPDRYDLENAGNRAKVDAVGKLLELADQAGWSLIALASGDEHAIKLTEAALRSYARSSDPLLLLAAADACTRLRG